MVETEFFGSTSQTTYGCCCDAGEDIQVKKRSKCKIQDSRVAEKKNTNFIEQAESKRKVTTARNQGQKHSNTSVWFSNFLTHSPK